MDHVKKAPFEEPLSSNQLAILLVVSAAFVSAGILFSSKVMGFKFPQTQETAVVSRQAKINNASDSEMRKKYNAAVSRVKKPLFHEAAPRLVKKTVVR